MATRNLIRYFFIFGVILTIIVASLDTGGNGTALIVVLISSVIFIAASLKTKNNK